MSRLTIFAKGNLDVRDTLHALRLGGRLVWNGINEALRERHHAVRARVRHETFTRSDALLEAGGDIPIALAEHAPSLGAFPAASQFSRAVFETDAKVIVLSAQPDAGTRLVRHRRDGFLLYPDDWRIWPPEQQRWLRASFIDAEPLTPAQSMENFERIVARIRQRSDAPILIYNVSSVTPGERVHCHQGLDDTASTRARRFNLGLVELSKRAGVSIIDVDSVIARIGADHAKYDAMHLTGAGCRAVAEEVVWALGDLGRLDDAEAGA